MSNGRASTSSAAKYQMRVAQAARLLVATTSAILLWWSFGLTLGQTLAVLWVILGLTGSWKHIAKLEAGAQDGDGRDA